ncbi:MAG: DapH/DapD/GlmU-related protein [Candidatus Omnitrophica bacterium]|nr:DapH/DapD/GlmU-related protein [Candidatus Omnitrophota bacterium]
MEYGKEELAIIITTTLIAYAIIGAVLIATIQVSIDVFNYLAAIPLALRILLTVLISYIVMLVLSGFLLYIGTKVIYKKFALKEGTYSLKSRMGHNWQIQNAWNALTFFVLNIMPAKDFGGFIILRWQGLKLKGGGLIATKAIIEPSMTEIGRDVALGADCLITGHIIDGEKLIFKKIIIGDKATIGGRALLMPGVKVGRNSIVAAGAVVPKYTVIPPNEIWGGVPARFIKKIEKKQRK